MRLRPCCGWLLAGLVLTGCAALSDEVPLSKVVPDYMEGDLETAIVPTPKEADLRDVCAQLTAPPLCICPGDLVEVQDALRESGLLEKKKQLESGEFKSDNERRQAERAFAGAWRAFSEKTAKPGWPNRAGFLMEIENLFPGVEFTDALPGVLNRPLLVLAVEGEQGAANSMVKKLPALPAAADKMCAPERYVIVCDAEQDGRANMLIHGASPWGALWGVETLRQMVFHKDGKSYVRLGTVRDGPTLWFRGWGTSFPMHTLIRSHNWWITAKPARVEKYKKDLAAAVAQGADLFMIDYNDGGFKTKDSPDEPFPADPAKTVKHLLGLLEEEKKKLGSDIRLGYMGSAYSLNAGANWEGEKLRKVNALDGASFVAMNGLQVFTDQFHHKAAQAYREAFGVDCKLLVYDCQCLERPMRALDYKDKEVWRHLIGVSEQAAPPLFFIGAADFAWNPEAYDPERALKLAVREMADRDPAFYKALHDYVSFYNANDYVPRYVPRAEMLALERKNTEGMKARLAKLQPFLQKGKMARLANLAGGVSGLSGIVPPVERRAERFGVMEKYGFKEYRVAKAKGIVIDGKADEAAWKNAPVMDTFIAPPGIKGLSEEPLPSGGRSIAVRALYDEAAVYLAAEIKGADEQTMEYVKKSLAGEPKAAEHHGLCHRLGATFELFIKPDLAQTVRWQVLFTVPNFYNGDLRHYFDPEDPFAANLWEPKPEFHYVLTGEDSYALEARLPIWEKLGIPKAGDVWGVQLQINKMLATKKTPHWLYWWSYSYKGSSSLFAFDHLYGRWIFE